MYCGEPLRLRDLEIDHIVPQSLEDDVAAWAHVREQQGLPDDFDINSYGNLAPACSACNGKKSALNLRAGRIGIELANAKRLTRQVEALIARFGKQSEAETVRFLIAEALSTGRLSQADVRDMTRADWVSPRILSEPESLFSGLNLQAIGDQDVARLKNTKTGPEDGVGMYAMAGEIGRAHV